MNSAHEETLKQVQGDKKNFPTACENVTPEVADHRLPATLMAGRAQKQSSAVRSF